MFAKILVSALVVTSSAFAGRDVPESVDKAYEQVLPLNRSQPQRILFRGGSPTGADFEGLRALGVRNVLNLQSSDEVSTPFEELGMKVMRVPLPPLIARPDKSALFEIIEILQDPKSYPLYVHCTHGRDRTGLVVALYRVLIENVSPQDAYEELLTNGFHQTVQIGLKCAFFEVLDLPAPKRCSLIPRKKIRLSF